MSLPSGSHIKIAGYEFLLDEGVSGHYVNHLEGLLVPRTDITGMPGKQNIRSEKLLWAFDDWSGGEGNRVYYPDDPTVYDYSDGLNPRIRGQLTGRPNRTTTNITPSNVANQPYFAIGGGSLWLAGSRNILESTDHGVTWTTQTTGISTGRIYSATGDFNYLYYCQYNSPTRNIYRIGPGGSPAETILITGGETGKGHMGMTVFNGRLYGWTGRQLWEYDIANTLPLGTDKYRKLYDQGVDLSPDGSGWWAGIVPAGDRIVFFTSANAQSVIYEFREGVPRPIWNVRPGFTVKAIMVVEGILFASGHFGGDSSSQGRGALYALDLENLGPPQFLCWFRKTQGLNLQMQQVVSSYGMQILVAAAWSGRIFVYDAELDAESELDDLHDDTGGGAFTDIDDKIGDLITMGTKRLAVRYTPGANTNSRTQWRVYQYDDDEIGNREQNTTQTLVSGEWDLGFPQEAKILQGFHVTFRPLVANHTIKIEAQLDNAAWVQIGATITAATPGNTTGRVWLAASPALSYYRLRYRITLASSSGAQPPILFSVTSESALAAYVQVWELVLRIKDEQSHVRPTSRELYAETIRDFMITAMKNKTQVVFVDGYTSGTLGTTEASTQVTIEQVDDVIHHNGQGSMYVKLRKVTV